MAAMTRLFQCARSWPQLPGQTSQNCWVAGKTPPGRHALPNLKFFLNQETTYIHEAISCEDMIIWYQHAASTKKHIFFFASLRPLLSSSIALVRPQLPDRHAHWNLNNRSILVDFNKRELLSFTLVINGLCDYDTPVCFEAYFVWFNTVCGVIWHGHCSGILSNKTDKIN